MARLIGTAGHVDHGKTTLIQALTGIDADRLPEEKQRGMTIDIGFAYIDLPEIGRVSVVDVPGHEKFIHNMLVGALGIDVALLCVSADEAVMPQTREHFDILRLLPVEQMVVALTRADLADEETRQLARIDVESLLKGSRFEGSPILPVSAQTGEGIEDLKVALTHSLQQESRQPAVSPPWYLPIDRVFSLTGHGTVVTGTLAQGKVATGERAILEPGQIEVRIRAIQSHDEPLETAEYGMRVALNLGGIKLEDVRRGMTIGAPGAVFETTIFDARMEWITRPKHNQRVRISIGSEEVMGKTFLSDTEPDIVQLRLEHPVAAAPGQSLIVRRYSPMELMGGGSVVVPQGKARRKSEVPVMVFQSGDEAKTILEILGDKAEGVPTEEICRLMGKTTQALGNTFEKLSEQGKVFGFAGRWISPVGFAEVKRVLLETLTALHEKNPAVSALPREQVMAIAKLPWAGKNLDRILAALAQEGLIVIAGNGIKLNEFKVRLSDKQQVFLARVKAALEQGGINVPTVQELARTVPAPIQAVEEILKLGMNAHEIVRIEDGLYYTTAQIEALKVQMKELFGRKSFAAADFRDRFQTSRKYTIPLLEFFDSNRVTLRQGDHRTLT